METERKVTSTNARNLNGSGEPRGIRSRARSRKFDLVGWDATASVFDLSFDRLVAMRDNVEFAEGVREYFRGEVEIAKRMLRGNGCPSVRQVEDYIRWKAKVAVVNVWLSSEVQRRIQMLPEKVPLKAKWRRKSIRQPEPAKVVVTHPDPGDKGEPQR